jgi:5-methyltetrahydrofolate--homocysteine methyltransferase
VDANHQDLPAALALDSLPLDDRGRAYLDAVRSRVVIFDGAMGTSLQLRLLTADDFGGPALLGLYVGLVFFGPAVVLVLHGSFLH